MLCDQPAVGNKPGRAVDPGEQGSWGCEQGDSYGGRVTAPGVEYLSRFEGMWMGRKMFKVGRKQPKKHGIWENKVW